MCQPLACSDPLPGIECRHLANKVFEDRFDAFPPGKPSSRVLLVKPNPDDAKYFGVETPTNIIEAPLYPLCVCKIRDLAFEDVGEDFLSLRQVRFRRRRR